MGFIRVSSFPILVRLEHDDTVVDTVTDEWGTWDVFEIEKIHWEELAGLDWNVSVTHPVSGQPFSEYVSANEDSSRNIPTPQRFPSDILIAGITLVGV